MELTTALGVAAGAAQFADISGRVLVEGISFLAALKHAPRRLSELCTDLQRSIERFEAINVLIHHPDLSSFSQLSTTQTDRIQQTLDTACHAIADLRTAIEPVVHTVKVSRTRQVWRAAVSVVVEKTIIHKLNRIDRLDKEILMELEMVGLAGATKINQMLDQLTTSCKAQSRESEERLVTIQSAIKENERRIHQNETSAVNINTRVNDQSHSIQEVIRQEGQVTRAEVRSLRDDISHLVTTRNAILLSRHEVPLLRSSITDMQGVTIHAADQPPSLLKALQESCNALSYNDRSQISLLQNATRKAARRKTWRCSLVLKLFPFTQRTVKLTLMASFEAGGASIGQNLRYFHTVERAKSPAFRLFDNLPKACSSILLGREALDHSKTQNHNFPFKIDSSGPIACYKWDRDLAKIELDRMHRDLRQLFTDGCASATDTDEVGNNLLHAVCMLYYFLESEREHLAHQLRNLAELIHDAGVEIYAAYDKLVFDTTTSFSIESELLNLSRMPALLRELRFTEFSGAPPTVKPPLLQSALFRVSNSQNATLRCCLRHADLGGNYISYLRKYPFLENLDYTELDTAIFNRDLQTTSSILARNKHRILSLIDTGDDVGPMELAVGWPEGLARLTEAGCIRLPALTTAMTQFDLKSLEILLKEKNTFLERDFQNAWAKVLRHLSSTTSNDESYLPMQKAVVRALVQRRQRLRHLAIQELPPSILSTLGLFDEIILDHTASKVYNALLDHDIDVPRNLLPALGRCACGSVYHALIEGTSSQNPSFCPQSLLELLHNEGFESIDCACDDGKSPLHKLCSRFAFQGSNKELRIVYWFLTKGASPIFSHSPQFPNIYHWLAVLFGRESRKIAQGRLQNLKVLINGVRFDKCDPMARDSCRCFCSPNGCTPVKKFWSCTQILNDHQHCESTTRRSMTEALRLWMKLCRLSKSQRKKAAEEICRLEIFDRLGMKHTCCGGHTYLQNFKAPRWQPSQFGEDDTHEDERYNGLEFEISDCDDDEENNDDQDDLPNPEAVKEDSGLSSPSILFANLSPDDDSLETQSEDTHLLNQLNLLMIAYRNLRRHSPSHSFQPTFWNSWEHWWTRLDSILPEPSPQQRCSRYCISNEFFANQGDNEESRLWAKQCAAWLAEEGLERNRVALEEKGFGGIEFEEVVRDWFGDLLEEE